ncbi:MAG: hypothetical protein Q8903_10170 [Bacteroidota bacterium]|nr:hypothetical protein [Bacteroidota bacterium]
MTTSGGGIGIIDFLSGLFNDSFSGIILLIIALFFLIIYLPNKLLEKKVVKNVEKVKIGRDIIIFVIANIIFLGVTYISIRIYNFNSILVKVPTRGFLNPDFFSDVNTPKMATGSSLAGIILQMISSVVFVSLISNIIYKLIKNGNTVLKNILSVIFYIIIAFTFFALEIGYFGFLIMNVYDYELIRILSIIVHYMPAILYPGFIFYMIYKKADYIS